MAITSALKSSGSTSLWRKIRERVLIRDGYICAYCGMEADTVDHVVPRRLGGTDDMDNLISACKRCNYSKGGTFFRGASTPTTPHGSFIPETATIRHYPED